MEDISTKDSKPETCVQCICTHFPSVLSLPPISLPYSLLPTHIIGLICNAVWQKPTQHCKAIILQFFFLMKIEEDLKETENKTKTEKPYAKSWLLFLVFWHQFSSVQFSHSVVSNSLQPHGLQHARPPRQSPKPGVYSNSCPLSQWRHPTISSSVIPFSSWLQSFPETGSFPMIQFFALGGQSIGVSTLASVLPMNIQVQFPLGWTGWVSLQSKGLSRVFSNTTVQKHQFVGAQLSL